MSGPDHRELVSKIEDLEIHPELQDDKQAVLEAVKYLGYNLKFASDRLKDDSEVVQAAVECDWRAIEFASGRLQNDTQIKKAVEDEKRVQEVPDMPSDWQGG